MERVWRRRPLVAAWLVAAMAAEPVTSGGQTSQPDELRQELEEMKEQLRRVQEQMKKQEAIIQKQQVVIDKLTAQKPAVAAPVGGAPPPPEQVQAAAAPPTAPAPAPPAPTTEKPREPWSPSQPITLLSGARGYMNISFDALMDFGWSTTANVTAIETGDHDPLQRGFTLPNEEIFLDGAVDPYFKGLADLVFKLDENNNTDVELEEVYLTTTSLPWNLQTKAGQFFSEFGRINQQHPHAWDFVDQPLVIGRMFGPEGLRNPGTRLSWLVPTPFYSEIFLAVQNSQGETAYSFRNSGTEFFGRPPLDRTVRNPGDLLYVPRLVASFDLTDSQTLVAGVSGAFGPNDSGSSTRTQIYGGDLYWKWKPSWQAGGFPFLAFQTEALGRRFEAGPVGGAAPLPSQALYDWGIYSQLLYGFTQRWVAGVRADWVSSNASGLPPADRLAGRFRWSPNLTFYPTEFSKIRLQYNYDHGKTIPNGDDSSVWMQVEFLLGSHAAHKF